MRTCVNSSVNEFMPIYVKSTSPMKPKGKSSNKPYFEMPLADHKKFFGQYIEGTKKRDMGKEHLATIYRDGIRISVTASHPDFVEAKAEETIRMIEALNKEGEAKSASSNKRMSKLAQELLDEVDRE